MNDSAYREKYGLSYAEFLAEPLDVYLRNLAIMEAEAEIQRAEARRAERKASSMG